MRPRRLGVAVAALVVGALLTTGAPAGAAADHDAAAVTVTWIEEGPDGPAVGTEDVAPDEVGPRLAELRQRPDVRVAEVDRRVAAQAEDPLQPLQWGLQRIRATEGWGHVPRADGQVLAVLDTGVDGLHLDLADVVLPGWDALGPTDGRTDPNGHGTHVAGIAAAIGGNGFDGAGTAPGLRILPVRVLDPAGLGSASDVAAGIHWAVDNGATIVNLSLGSREPSQVLAEAIRYAVGRGVVVVAAAGNLADDTPVWPAAMREVIGVTATDQSDALPSYASHGLWVDLAAPGDGILSTYTANTVATLSGTSMATPFVAGVVALLRAREPDLTPAMVRGRVRYNAEDIGVPGRDADSGFGLLSAAATLEPVPTFADVRGGAHAAAIRELVADRITSGCGDGRFCPGTAVTRGQLATFLVRTLRLPPASRPAGFTDTGTSGHAGAIDALAEVGITSGCAPERFCPDAPISRAEMATLLSRALDLRAQTVAPFRDVAPTSTHAVGIAATSEAGITTGCSADRYCPGDTVSRAQVAALLARAFLGL